MLELLEALEEKKNIGYREILQRYPTGKWCLCKRNILASVGTAKCPCVGPAPMQPRTLHPGFCPTHGLFAIPTLPLEVHCEESAPRKNI